MAYTYGDTVDANCVFEVEGTYPLPEAQRDRFLLKIAVPFPAAADERAMLAAYAEGRHLHAIALSGLSPVIDLPGLVAARRALSTAIRVDEPLLDYLMAIVRATREDEAVRIGAGPRATLSLLACSRALACLRGRDFVSPDDIKQLAHGVLIHRVSLTAESEMEGVRLEDVLTRVFARIEVPR
jgi:MoxR-like ATPase